MTNDYILGIVKEIPKKTMKRNSKVNSVLRELYDTAKSGEIVQFDPKKAGVNAVSLRAQLRTLTKQGIFAPNTKIISRNKEWFLRRG